MTKFIYDIWEQSDGQPVLDLAAISKDTPQGVEIDRAYVGGAFDHRVTYPPDCVHRTAEAAVRAYMARKDQEVEMLYGAIGATERQADAAEKLLPMARKLDREAKA